MASRIWRQILASLISQLIKWNSLRGIEWSLRAFASMGAVPFFFASTSSDQFSHASSEHFRSFKNGEQRDAS